MRFEPLPHAYPFRFADRTVERTGPGAGRVRAVVSAGGRGVSGGIFPGALVGELMAQAALLVSGADPDLGKSGFLAGFSDLTVERPAFPGDVLTIDVAIAGRMGPAVKFDASVRDAEGARVASGSVTVRRGESAPEGRA
jgi:3-hydroxymyristoyl/3-hydroxydecanoyl-(acyl carrier protein) dehydratase